MTEFIAAIAVLWSLLALAFTAALTVTGLAIAAVNAATRWWWRTEWKETKP